jgi:hypothetical protein
MMDVLPLLPEIYGYSFNLRPEAYAFEPDQLFLTRGIEAFHEIWVAGHVLLIIRM